MLIDSHCHLDFPALAQDRAGVLTRARAAGVLRFLNISTTKTDALSVRMTAESEPDVFATVGAHPHHVEEVGEDFTTDELIVAARHPKIVAIGETGLDYFYEQSPRAVQQLSFRNHIRAANTAKLPLVIHTRNADDDTAQILKEEGGQGVLHCFTSSRALAEKALGFGFSISLSGILTFKKSQELRDLAKDIPLDRLLVETDSPYLAPEPHRGRPCEPAYVVHTARVLAEIKGVAPELIAQQTTENFFRLFTKVPRP